MPLDKPGLLDTIRQPLDQNFVARLRLLNPTMLPPLSGAGARPQFHVAFWRRLSPFIKYAQSMPEAAGTGAGAAEVGTTTTAQEATAGTKAEAPVGASTPAVTSEPKVPLPLIRVSTDPAPSELPGDVQGSAPDSHSKDSTATILTCIFREPSGSATGFLYDTVVVAQKRDPVSPTIMGDSDTKLITQILGTLALSPWDLDEDKARMLYGAAAPSYRDHMALATIDLALPSYRAPTTHATRNIAFAHQMARIARGLDNTVPDAFLRSSRYGMLTTWDGREEQSLEDILNHPPIIKWGLAEGRQEDCAVDREKIARAKEDAINQQLLEAEKRANPGWFGRFLLGLAADHLTDETIDGIHDAVDLGQAGGQAVTLAQGGDVAGGAAAFMNGS